MLQNVASDPGALAPEELRAQYDDRLRETVETVGAATVAEEAGVSRESVDALAAGESPDLTLEEAAAILATEAETPDADAIEMEVLDELMMGMSIAVVDVESLEADLDGELDAKEIQQKIEGRFPVSLSELAAIQQAIEARKP
ncbi:DUF5791 family protein [Halomarina ordinaria]|uniref:DUF5791 family protein n=1 Tax=Halomarina ordinaria TaxID=3033939 RepID=A0ABD5UB97_9EURY|nr:DUF5791 family protein [Halomarina sp. PSRA2]